MNDMHQKKKENGTLMTGLYSFLKQVVSFIIFGEFHLEHGDGRREFFCVGGASLGLGH